MKWIAEILVAAVSLEHLAFLWLEMFAWTSWGPRIFKSQPAEQFSKTKSMAANQGLCNGFLSAGLIWSLIVSDPTWSMRIGCFFLSCVLVAGLYGAWTVQRTIFWVQSLPALLAMAFLLLA